MLFFGVLVALFAGIASAAEQGNGPAAVYIARSSVGSFLGSAGNYFSVFWGNSTLRVIVPVLVVLVALFIYLRTRETRANNMKKARRYHKKGAEQHEKGREDRANEYFEMSRFYREKGA